MKYITLLLLVLSSIAYAENPQRRVCRLNGAQFLALDITEPRVDNVGICFFNEKSLMGSISLILAIHEGKDSQASKAFKKTKYATYKTCKDANAFKSLAKDTNGKTYPLCLFSDDSFVGEQTLIDGWYYMHNSRLTKLL